ncbi:MAG TPA: hypothetical protein VG435_03785 [Acidimicrobiales bacterium]|jgi:hypothetical protein|nr:hypothetical protein [Acidimicrobiales bacterium]
MSAVPTVASIHVTDSVQQAINQVFSYLPNIVGFLVILFVGYIIARVIKGIANAALGRMRVDQHLANSAAGGYVERVSPGGKPSRFVGGIVFWLIFLYALTAAIGALQIPSVTAFMNQVLDYLPNVIAAVIIFVIAAAISAGVAAAAKKTMGDTPTGKLAETIIPGLVMAIAMFMILEQLRIATSIVVITYAALIGMLALIGALAFGLGGRDVAGQIWSQAYQSSQNAKDQAKDDLNVGKRRAKAQMADGSAS